jgi:hypothetical protein
MIARYGLPGESKFTWQRFSSRKQAQEWIDGKFDEAQSNGFPQGIPRCEVLTEKTASKCRWKDGRRIFVRDEDRQ